MSDNRNNTDQKIAAAVLGAALLPPIMMVGYVMAVPRQGSSETLDGIAWGVFLASGVVLLLRSPLSRWSKLFAILVYLPTMAAILMFVGFSLACSKFNVCL